MPNKKSLIEMPSSSVSGRLAEESPLRAAAKPFRLVFDRSERKLVERTSDQSLVEQRLADWTEEILENLSGVGAPADATSGHYVALAGWARFDNDKLPLGLLGQIESLVQK